MIGRTAFCCITGWPVLAKPRRQVQVDLGVLYDVYILMELGEKVDKFG